MHEQSYGWMLTNVQCLLELLRISNYENRLKKKPNKIESYRTLRVRPNEILSAIFDMI